MDTLTDHAKYEQQIAIDHILCYAMRCGLLLIVEAWCDRTDLDWTELAVHSCPINSLKWCRLTREPRFLLSPILTESLLRVICGHVYVNPLLAGYRIIYGRPIQKYAITSAIWQSTRSGKSQLRTHRCCHRPIRNLNLSGNFANQITGNFQITAADWNNLRYTLTYHVVKSVCPFVDRLT